jgi:hypothetical protein
MQSVALSMLCGRLHSSKRHARRTTRNLVQCELLEDRRLLSSAPSVPGAVVLPHSTGSSAEIAAAANASALAISSRSSIASEFETSSSVSSAQFSFLVDEFANSPTGVSQSVGAVATTAPLTTNPAANLLGSTLTLTNLSVSVLNPQMTSFTDAILDDQVNSDAFLVPASTEVLEEELGERVTLPVTLWNTNAFNTPSQNQAPPPQHSPVGRNPVSHVGQSFGSIPDANPRGLEGGDFSEPPPAVGPIQGPQAQSGPQPGKAPAQPGALPETGVPKREQVPPETNKTPQPAPNGDQTAPQGTRPGQPPNGGQSPTQGPTPGQPEPPRHNPDGSPAPRKTADTDPSQSLSVMFGTAILAIGGNRLVMRQKDRSQGRDIPRSWGAELPTRRKTPSSRGS